MQEDWKPKLEMTFDNIEDAWKFWIDYGGRVGFRVRKQYSTRTKMVQSLLISLFVVKKACKNHINEIIKL